MYCTNYQLRMDTLAYVLFYPQKPLVQSTPHPPSPLRFGEMGCRRVVLGRKRSEGFQQAPYTSIGVSIGSFQFTEGFNTRGRRR
jgi:hypothetical protein